MTLWFWPGRTKLSPEPSPLRLPPRPAGITGTNGITRGPPLSKNSG